MKFKKIEIMFLVILTVISITLRFYGIDRPDFYADESVQVMAIKDFVATKNVAFLQVFNHPPLFLLAVSFPALLFGINEYTIRIVDAFFGALTTFIVYFLTRMWYEKRYAILASILFAVAPMPVLYSRLAFGYTMSLFFTIASIFAIEYLISHKLKKNHEVIMIFVSGILIGLTFLTRFNSLPIFGLYWLFILSYSFLRERNHFRKYLYYAFIIHLIALALFLLGILALGGVSMLVYVIYQFFFIILQQSTLLDSNFYSRPFYYHIAVLFDGISPFLYILLPFALIYLMIHKKRTRTDVMLSFLVFVFFIIITFQERKFSRHQLVIYALLIIALSRFIIKFSLEHIKKVNITVLSSIFILGTLSWTVFEIHQTHDFNVWGQVGDYIEKNYDSSVKVHAGYVKNRQVKTHLTRNIETSLSISSLNKGDLVIFAFLYENTTILEDTPFQDKSTLFENKFAGRKSRSVEFRPDYYKYVLEHGTLVKTFEYKGKTAVWIYQIKNTNDKGSYEDNPLDILAISGWKQLENSSIFGLWDVICDNFGKDNLINSIIDYLASGQQKKEIEMHCSKSKS